MSRLRLLPCETRRDLASRQDCETTSQNELISCRLDLDQKNRNCSTNHDDGNDDGGQSSSHGQSLVGFESSRWPSPGTERRPSNSKTLQAVVRVHGIVSPRRRGRLAISKTQIVNNQFCHFYVTIDKLKKEVSTI